MRLQDSDILFDFDCSKASGLTGPYTFKYKLTADSSWAVDIEQKILDDLNSVGDVGIVEAKITLVSATSLSGEHTMTVNLPPENTPAGSTWAKLDRKDKDDQYYDENGDLVISWTRDPSKAQRHAYSYSINLGNSKNEVFLNNWGSGWSTEELDKGSHTFKKSGFGNEKLISVLMEVESGFVGNYQKWDRIYIKGPAALDPNGPILTDKPATWDTSKPLDPVDMAGGDTDNLAGETATLKLKSITNVGTGGEVSHKVDINGTNVTPHPPTDVSGAYRYVFDVSFTGGWPNQTRSLTLAVIAPGTAVANDDTKTCPAFQECKVYPAANDENAEGYSLLYLEPYSPGDVVRLGDRKLDGPDPYVTVIGKPASDGTPGTYSPTYGLTKGSDASNPAKITFTFVNNAPIAANDSGIEVAANQTVDITDTLLKNDSDPNVNDDLDESDAFYIYGVTQPASSNASVTRNYGKVTFWANAAGTYTFQYQLADLFGATSKWAKVTVTVTSPNVAPVINSLTTNKTSVIHDPFAGPYDETFNATCSATDANGDSLTYTLTGNGAITNTGTGTWTVNPAPAASGNQTYTCTVSDGNGGSDSADTIPQVYVSADLYGHSLPNTGAFDFENVAVGDIAEFEFTAPATASDVMVACSAFSNPVGFGPPTVVSVDVVPVAAGSWSGGGCAAASALQIMVVDGVPNLDVFTYTPGQRYVVYLSNPAGPDDMDIHCDVSAWYEFTDPAGLAAQALTNVVRGVNPGGACP